MTIPTGYASLENTEAFEQAHELSNKVYNLLEFMRSNEHFVDADITNVVDTMTSYLSCHCGEFEYEDYTDEDGNTHEIAPVLDPAMAYIYEEAITELETHVHAVANSQFMLKVLFEKMRNQC